MINKEQIHSFWQWFSSVACDFEQSSIDDALIAILDARIAELGNFAWELGPGIAADHALTISPGGERGLLGIIQELIVAAPAIPGWEFYSAKPPKQWIPMFTVEGVDGNDVEVDARKWRYVLLRYPDGMFEVIIEAPELWLLPKEIQMQAAEIVLDGYLGEQKRLERVVSIDITQKLNAEFEYSASPIESIKFHII